MIASFLVTNRQSDSALRWCDGYLRVLLDSGMAEEDVAIAFATLAFYINPMFLVEGTHADNGRMFPVVERVSAIVDECKALTHMQPYLDAVAHDDEYVIGARQLIELLDRRPKKR